VYFIQDSVGLEIKIGWSRCVASRLEDLQHGNPRRLILLGTMPGDRQEEMRLHARFAKSRLLGEWFLPCPDLLKLIDENCVVAGRASQ
jgi:hypothetical protein